MKITLCDKNLGSEDIPVYDFKCPVEASDFVHDWLSNKGFEDEEEWELTKSVFVCFRVYRKLPVEKSRDEIRNILVSHDFGKVHSMAENYAWIEEDEMIDDFKDIDFCIFEFESYAEAFAYCADLMESF